MAAAPGEVRRYRQVDATDSRLYLPRLTDRQRLFPDAMKAGRPAPG